MLAVCSHHVHPTMWDDKPRRSSYNHVSCSKALYEGLRRPRKGHQVLAKRLYGNLHFRIWEGTEIAAEAPKVWHRLQTS